MANKALKIVGIGCGVLVLLGIIAMVAGGMWAKSKLKGVEEWGTKLEEQNKELKSLDSKYSFTKPPKGAPLKLEDARLKKYFAVRQELQPVLKKYEAEGKKLDKKEGEEATMGEGLAALGMMGDMMAELRTKFIEELDKHEMSPREFHYTTAAIYSSSIGAATNEMNSAAREAMEEQIKAYEERLAEPDVTAEEKQELEGGIAETKKSLGEMQAEHGKDPATTEIHMANAKLLESYKQQVEDQANLVLDGVLATGDDDWTDAMEQAN